MASRGPVLLTPGPITTSAAVRAVMAEDLCTWGDAYGSLVDDLRARLVRLATPESGFTSILLQGTGSYAVEATMGTAIPPNGKALLINNGAYGNRLVLTANKLKIPSTVLTFPETEPADPEQIEATLRADSTITTLVIVHSETTTGLCNPVEVIGPRARALGKTVIVDAVSSFGGIPLTLQSLGANYLVSTASKCLEGVPGLGLVIADRDHLEQTRGWARGYAFDLFDQWQFMELKGFRWRFTSSTYVVRALAEAVRELEAEGGVTQRNRRYQSNRQALLAGMTKLGFQTLLPEAWQTPILTAFRFPTNPRWSFRPFYEELAKRNYFLYPGKASKADAFRVGTIGAIDAPVLTGFTNAVAEALSALQVDWIS